MHYKLTNRKTAFAMFTVAAFVAGCSSAFRDNKSSQSTLTNYESIVLASPPVSLAKSRGQTLEIANGRPTMMMASQPGEWIVCVRITPPDNPRFYYAIFLEGA